jgi:MFS family permease
VVLVELDEMKLSRGIYYSVGALAGAALMLESTLTRMLAVAQYYHFAFLVISLALLGFGASGSLLTVFSSWMEKKDQTGRHPGAERIVVIAGVGFTASLAIAYLVVNMLPFDSYSIAWDRSQVFYFILYYLVLTLPFLFAGLGIGAVISASPGLNNRVYAVNLLGSALGILLGLMVMQLAGVPGALLASALIGLSTVLGTQVLSSRVLRSTAWLFLVIGTSGVFALTYTNQKHSAPLGITISPYKGLPYALQVPGAEKLYEGWNAFSRIDVIGGASTHVLPGLSYAYNAELPEQLGMAFDGDALRPITMLGPGERFQAAEYLPEAIAYELHPGGRALVLAAGSGLGVQQAVSGGAGEIFAVLENPMILEAIDETAPDSNIYNHPGVHTEIEATRAYLARYSSDFDVISLPLNDPYRPVANGAYSLAEDFILTVDAFAEMLSRVKPDGNLVVTRWLQTPPSEELRLLATIIEALNKSGMDQTGNKIVAYRGIQTMTYLIQPGGWQQEQLELIREFTEQKRFDLVWAPDIDVQETNRFNILDEPLYYQHFGEFLGIGDLESIYADHPYAIKPATDDQPFFYHFFKWAQTPQVLATFGRVWQPFGGSGYFVLIALLVLVSLFSVTLIVIPLLIRSRIKFKPDRELDKRGEASAKIPTWKVLIYFGSIGIAFLFIEIPLIQRSILSLGQPAYAFGFVVLVLLVSSSLGSFYSRRLWAVKGRVMLLLLGIVLLTPLIFRQLQYTSLGWPEWLRVFSLGISLVPMGVLMGVPFPFGLEWLEKAESNLTPWAWAVNGCASVVAAVLAAIISLSAGFTVVLLLGAMFYGVAAIVMRN